jgi:hypothetical protein
MSRTCPKCSAVTCLAPRGEKTHAMAGAAPAQLSVQVKECGRREPARKCIGQKQLGQGAEDKIILLYHDVSWAIVNLVSPA